jgi:hypothetical protein
MASWVSQLAEVVQHTNAVESQMKSVISAYFDIAGGKRDFFEANFLNNAIVSFASKIKMVLAINKRAGLVTDLDRDAFHKLNSRRNAFAHQDVFQSMRWGPPEDGSSRGVRYVLESMKGDGEFEVLTREQAFEQFMEAYLKVHPCLLMMHGELAMRKRTPPILGEEFKPEDQ